MHVNQTSKTITDGNVLQQNRFHKNSTKVEKYTKKQPTIMLKIKNCYKNYHPASPFLL